MKTAWALLGGENPGAVGSLVPEGVDGQRSLGWTGLCPSARRLVTQPL